jgi:hypothetical protein
MAGSVARGWGMLCLGFALMSFCHAQKVSAGPDASGARPEASHSRIFQQNRGSQALQLAVSGKNAAAQVSTANYRVASSEETAGMEQTLEKYQAAFENLSLPQVRQIWPTLDREHEAAFKKVFAAFREASWSRQLQLECVSPRVTADAASVDCIETLTYGTAKGKSKQLGPARVAIVLKRESSQWVVADMKGGQ